MALTKIPSNLITAASVDESLLNVSNSPTNGYFLSAQSGNTGGLTWAEVDTSTLAPLANPTLTGTPAAPTASGSTSTTQIATTAFVQQELTTLIGGAPSTLNDLNELAAAINDDANYNSTLTTALATKVPLAGGTMTGNLVVNAIVDADNFKINNAQGSDGQVITSTGSGVAWESLPAGGATSIDGLSDATTSESGSIMLGTATHGTISGAAQNTSVGIGAMDAITSAEYTVAIGYNAATALNSGSYNTAVGGNAFITNQNGHSNTMIGMSAGKFNLQGSSNVAVGRNALVTNVNTDRNTAVGTNALNLTTVSDGTAVGYDALKNNATGANNVAVGSFASDAITTGSWNVAVGVYALSSNQTRNSNTAVGNEALSTTTGEQNTAVGYQALRLLQDAHGHTAVGFEAMMSATGGASNVAVGYRALKNNLTKNYNTAMGKGALEYFGRANANSDGWNTAVGAEAMGGSNSDDISYSNAFGGRALKAVTSADYNNMFGYRAGTSITTGGSNTAMGHNAAASLTDGASNVAIGRDALELQQGATDNIAIGAYAMDGCNSASTSQVIAIGSYAASGALAGHNNQFIGYQSGEYATSAFYNTAIGNGSLSGSGSTAFTGDHNVAIGHNAAPNITSGYRNVCIGQTAGSGGTSFGYGTYLGMETAVSAANETNSIVIGNGATGKGSNTGFMSANGGANYAGNNSSSWSTTSDRRIKKNIEDNTTGLEALNQIRVRNFEYRTEDEILDFDNPKAAVVEREGLQLGVIAQEIEEILPDVVMTLESGVKTVDPDNLTWYLINAVKELSAKNDTLEARIATLEG